jgi:hypothetical protein
MALPGLHEIEKDRDSPGFLWQVGVPFLLALGTLAHDGWLQAGEAGLPPVAEAMLGSMLSLGVFSALLIRLAIVAFSRGNPTRNLAHLEKLALHTADEELALIDELLGKVIVKA